MNNVLSLITLGVAVVACFFAYKIPFRIMQNQIYADLMKEYRSKYMLENIEKMVGICGYHGDYRGEKCLKDCQVLHKCKVLGDKLQNYGKDEENEIEKVIFRSEKSARQSISQWYWQLANLLFTKKYFGNTKEIKKLAKTNFTKHDSDIICIIYHLNRGLDMHCYRKESGSKFTKLLKKLFRESKCWKDNN